MLRLEDHRTESEKSQTDRIAELVASEFDFSVVKRKMESVCGLESPLWGLYRSDDDSFVGRESVSEKYVPHTVDDVAALIEASTGLFEGELDIRTHWNDGHIIIIQPRDIEAQTINGNDGLIPALVIRAQYNKRAFTANMGMFRFLCQNMLMLSSMKGTSVSIRHTNSLREKMDNLIQTFSGLDNSFDLLMNGCLQMSTNWFRLTEFVEAVYGEKPEKEGSKLSRWTKMRDQIRNTIQRERSVLNGEFVSLSDHSMCTGWELYNAIQGHSQHHKTRRNDPSKDQRVILAADDQRVMKAERIALSGELA